MEKNGVRMKSTDAGGHGETGKVDKSKLATTVVVFKVLV
jgi:hypothetical protein